MINFFCEDIEFVLKEKLRHKRWIKNTILSENQDCGDINFIFTSDKFLLEINKKYLEHNYYTDVITFDTTDYFNKKLISGDVFISVESVRSNAQQYGELFENEMRRVIIHGVLHLLGYDDHTDEDKHNMRERENIYLNTF